MPVVGHQNGPFELQEGFRGLIKEGLSFMSREISAIGSCESCGSEIEVDDLYMAARRFQSGINDPFALIHVDCPKDHRAKAEALLLMGGGSAIAHAIMALIEKLDELPIIALTPVEVGDDDEE